MLEIFFGQTTHSIFFAMAIIACFMDMLKILILQNDFMSNSIQFSGQNFQLNSISLKRKHANRKIRFLFSFKYLRISVY